MGSERIQRKLAAILVADVASYSKLVGADEGGTLAHLKALRTEIIEPMVAQHAGRLFKAVGDGFLIEFASAVQAVSCAKAIQQANSGGSLQLRIGIHLGDVVVEGDDLLGDGVNIAARIEGLADPGGIALSRQVHDQVRDRLDLAFIDKGESTLKNIARPVHVFALGGRGAPAEFVPTLALPDRPSIAVLPFQNMSGDPEQEYFVDGLVEDIITALTRFKSLFVIARNSSFTYKGKAVDIKQVGRELGVRYVLEGSVRKAGGRLRITGQLINASTGSHLWADRFDGPIEDVFDLQDRITSSVAGLVGARVEEVEIERARQRPANNLDAYDCFLRGQSIFQSRTREALEEAHRLFKRAIELDPDFATPYGLAARCYSTLRLSGYLDDAETAKADVRRFAESVTRIGRDDAIAMAWVAFALLWVCGDHEAGEAMIDRAISINPNLAVGWQVRGYVSQQLGAHERALEEFARAARLSPLGQDYYLVQGYSAFCLMFLGRYDEALRKAAEVMAHLPKWPGAAIVCTASSALMGKLGDAATYLTKVRELNPNLRQSNISELFGTAPPQDVDCLARGLRLAGLPERATPALALPDKPSIAVLPFQNMSGDPEQEYFVDGLVEDIITALSRFKSMFVIARNSSFTYKGKAVDIKQVGRELGVRYVLEGSVRKAGGRVRITGQLIDSQTGSHLWADRFDGAVEDVFDLQDKITGNVAGQLPVTIEMAEINRLRIRPTSSLTAYDSHLLGMKQYYASTRESLEQALKHYYKAIELDPDFGEPHIWAALSYSMRKQNHWVADVQREIDEGIRLARRAAELRPDDAAALGTAGFSLAYLGGHIAAGIDFMERALALNQNNAHVWHGSGWVRCYNGDHDLAIEHIGRAERLSPVDPQMAQLHLAKGMAHYCAGRYEVSASLMEGLMQRHPNLIIARTNYARALAMMGRLDEARALMKQALELNPDIRISNNTRTIMRRPEDRARILEGYRLAGMPE